MSAPQCIPVVQGQTLDFHGNTLLLPTTSVASVPQLALDLLIHAPSLQFRRVAYLDSSEHVPFVSPGEGGDSVYTALDGTKRPPPTSHVVYQSPRGLTVVQQRSPAFKRCKTHVAERLMQWIQDAQFADVVILSSMDAAYRTDAEFSTPLVYVRPPQAGPAPTARVQTLTTTFPAFAPAAGAAALPPLPGAGMARDYLNAAPANTAALSDRCSVWLVAGYADAARY
ncbi:hypothetical protein MSPP1_000249 [Malassezia sp. CBS 17886]|nr:hypothetical protein MSPP1_000249 [Malassezia sp. CBS 17886]